MLIMTRKYILIYFVYNVVYIRSHRSPAVISLRVWSITFVCRWRFLDKYLQKITRCECLGVINRAVCIAKYSVGYTFVENRSRWVIIFLWFMLNRILPRNLALPMPRNLALTAKKECTMQELINNYIRC